MGREGVSEYSTALSDAIRCLARLDQEIGVFSLDSSNDQIARDSLENIKNNCAKLNATGRDVAVLLHGAAELPASEIAAVVDSFNEIIRATFFLGNLYRRFEYCQDAVKA
jgi:replicative DNA helicase